MPRSRLTIALASLAVAAASGCYNDPNRQLDQLQETLAVSDALNELSARTSELGFMIDSLRAVVAKQDSTLAQLANLAGVSYPR